MNFASDNWAGAHPVIAQSLALHAAGFASAYGTSDLDGAIERTFCEIFEKDVAVFFVATGTAANALALAAYDRPGGVSFGYEGAHILTDECGAPEYFMGGSRLRGVGGTHGRIDPTALEAALDAFPPDFVHAGRPAAISITQASEIGTVYSPSDIEAISSIARAHGLPLHMDGARFANALVALDVSPAEMTWKRGVDVLSFGGTKNGCWCAEAVVFFNPGHAAEFPYLRKRAGQLFSKSRFVAAQFDAYFRDGLWLENARHANAMAALLAERLDASGHARLGWQPQANEVFPILPKPLTRKLRAQGASFADWRKPSDLEIGQDEILCRLVTSFATTPGDVAQFVEIVG